MDAYETTDLIDQLVKAKIPKKTATHLLNYVDKTQNEKTDFKLNVILWIMGLYLGVIQFLSSFVSILPKGTSSRGLFFP